MNKTGMRIVGALFLIGAVGLAWHFGWFDYLTIENLRSLESTLGPWAPLAFVAAFVVGELIQVPSIFWILCAGLIWPWWIALPLSFFAAMLAATVAFLVARYILGGEFHEKIPKQFAGLNEALKRSPFKAVLMIRLTTFLHPVVHWMLAASPVGLPVFLLGTALGIVPGVLAIVFLGQTFVTWWDEYAYWLIGGVVTCAVAYFYFDKVRGRSETP